MIIDVTQLSKVVYCDSLSSYEQVLSKDIYDEYTLYLVKVSTTSLSVFYGSRLLTDILVVDELPKSSEYPYDTLFLLKSKGQIQGVYYKESQSERLKPLYTYKGQDLRKLTQKSSSLSSLEFFEDSGTVVQLSSGRIPADILNKFVEEVVKYLTDYIRPKYEDMTHWGTFT